MGIKKKLWVTPFLQIFICYVVYNFKTDNTIGKVYIQNAMKFLKVY